MIKFPLITFNSYKKIKSWLKNKQVCHLSTEFLSLNRWLNVNKNLIDMIEVLNKWMVYYNLIEVLVYTIIEFHTYP